MTSVTLIGLVPDVHVLEDIRIEVPYRIAVQVPVHLAARSPDLQLALQQRKVMQLGRSPMAAHANPLPPPPTPTEPESWRVEKASLLRELESAKGLNTTLQTLLTTMSGQLTSIQRVLEALRTRGVSMPTPAEVFGEAAPMFIPDRIKTDAVEVSITVPENTVQTDLSGARGALRALRGKL